MMLQQRYVLKKKKRGGALFGAMVIAAAVVVLLGFPFAFNVSAAPNQRALSELTPLVYDEARVVEREFDRITAIDIQSITDNITVVRGGDTVTVRYHEWFPQEYRFTVSNGLLSIVPNLPAAVTNRNGMRSQNHGWLSDYLKEQGKVRAPVEIIIPEGVALDNFNADIATGDIDIRGVALGDAEINVAVGNADIRDTAFVNVMINIAVGNMDWADCAFDTAEINIAIGNGTVRLSNKATEYDITFFSSFGRLIYNGQTVNHRALRTPGAASSLTLSTAFGSLAIDD